MEKKQNTYNLKITYNEHEAIMQNMQYRLMHETDVAIIVYYGENSMDSYTRYNPDTQLATGIFINSKHSSPPMQVLWMGCSASTIRDECRIMASITCDIFPDLQSKFHALDNVDLSMKIVCGRTFTYEEEYVKDEVRQRYASLNKNDISDIISTRILPMSDTENCEENFCEQMLVD